RGSVSTTVGSRDLRMLRFDLSGPIVDDTLYASVAGAWRGQDGWYAQASLSGAGPVYLDAANRYRRSGYALVNLATGVTVRQVE
ncbi:hypothetical protein L7A49_33015, partial [Achromobacter xylosoxidans]|nr:hypothetical protein [Achromobacter xylosoxidans]